MVTTNTVSMSVSHTVVCSLKLLLLFMVAFMARQSEGYISCDDVIGSLMPCVDYARYGGTVSEQCCSAVRQLSHMARSTEDRQQVCACGKGYAPLVPGLNFNFINKIPKKCGVHLSLNISPDIDCSKVK
ncbi:Plant lipid transfer protein/Par allergen [Macleaya cordata]|uniref:Non-specific lipid-transfer protein n=1 Tax=Macleaya cordata TaxID=56857 RepID=A0A200R3I2_MACCD|nr:Plant lipid transfer protein/Par allergen [Macleaya cordata]